jgi:peptidoglycan/LPS O-acetylase OafA/YrhL
MALYLNKIYNLLKRTTASTQFIPAIDGLRFLAIWVVVMEHAHGFIKNKVPFRFEVPPESFPIFYRFFDSQGLKGVLLFFMISGFILGMPFAKHYWFKDKPVELKKYFLRRLTRLEPPYILNLLVSFFVILLFSGHGFAQSFFHAPISLFTNLVSSLFYVHYIFFPNVFSVNPVTWSLELEVQFYILVPLLVLIFKLPKFYRRALLLSAIVIFPLVQEYFLQPVNAAQRPVSLIYYYIQYFLLGFLLLDVYLSGFKLKLAKGFNFLLGFLLLFVFFALDLHDTPHFGLFFPYIIFALGVFALTNEAWTKIFSLKPLTAIGGMCYSIYLWHNLTISAVGNFTIHLNIFDSYIPAILWHLFIIIPFVLAVSVVFYLSMEEDSLLLFSCSSSIIYTKFSSILVFPM